VRRAAPRAELARKHPLELHPPEHARPRQPATDLGREGLHQQRRAAHRRDRVEDAPALVDERGEPLLE
jgi:hypothetical protein